MKKDKETKTLDKMKGLLENLIVDSTDKCYEGFMKLDKEIQKKDFAQKLTAQQIVDYIVDIIKNIDSEKRIEMMDKYDEIAHIFSAVLSYLELGLTLGYTEKVEK